MTTKQNGIITEKCIYESPFDAFTNYMNILADFITRVNAQYPEDIDNEELNALLKMISNQNEEIAALNEEIAVLKSKPARKCKKKADAAE
jgi:alpha-amylase